MAGITSGLTSLLGIDTNAGSAELQQAAAALQAIGVPNAAQLTLPELQKYVAAGVLTPQQYQAIQEDPQAYQQAFQAASDSTGKNAQSAALQQLGSIVQAGGSTPINQANLENNINQTNQAMQAARGGIENQAQQRGVAGGGLEFINKLMNEQSNAQNAHMGAVQAGSDNARLALQALSDQGNLGSTMQGQANQSQQAQAQAAAQIAQYNSQLQSAANQYNTQNANAAQAGNLANAQEIGNQNTGNANYRTQYNAQVPQQIFQDQMQKAQGIAGNLGQQGQLKQQQAQMGAGLTGRLIGAGATVLGGIYGGHAGAAVANKAVETQTPANYNDNPYGNYAHGGEILNPNERRGMTEEAGNYNQGGICYAQGGEVHDHELCMQAGGDVPGDDQAPMMQDNEANDTVHANLSPGEIVLPRSVAQAPNAPQQAAQFVGQTKGTPVSSFAEALAKLEENGLELRLCPKAEY
jgi:hypothetical protein